ncbi:MAG: hypothetical protein LBI13_05755 [Streptococcaceae bacterium]|jgi:MGT family glycosyltransferase|nr:hypothetical protein [Streptococcaceae bacterium]
MQTIIYFGTPAHGHVNPSLSYVEKLVARNFQVIYYATPEFQQEIVQTGAEFRAYPLSIKSSLQDLTDSLTDNKHLFRALTLSLKLTTAMLPELLNDIKLLNPALIIHDCVNLVGRLVAELSDRPALSFYPFVFIDHVGDKASRLYARHFSQVLFFGLSDLFPFLKAKAKVKKLYHAKRLSLIDLNFNQEAFNLVSFSRLLQPESHLQKNYFFIGPSASLRRSESQEIEIPSRPFIYATLGTVAKDDLFIDEIIRQFANSSFDIILIVGKNKFPTDIPKNIHVYDYVNQPQVLPHATLVLSTGGMNTINEAIRAHIPLLIYPGQGEQRINADQVESLKLGRRLKNLKILKKEAEQLLHPLFQINDELYHALTDLQLDEAVIQTEKYLATTKHYINT